MKQEKVKRHTVGFFRNDAEVPFINLEMFELSQPQPAFPTIGVMGMVMCHSFGMLV